MENDNQELNLQENLSDETVRNILKNQIIANTAVRKAQEENRRLSIPNWYSINGEIISDIEIAAANKNKK